MRYIVCINGLQHARTASIRDARRLAALAAGQGSVLVLDLDTGKLVVQ